MIERQPSCVLRVGVDGLLLAVNDAALCLLGARELAQVLGGNVQDRLAPGQDNWWAEFAGRISAGGSGSGECEMLDLSGAERSVTLQGRALMDHPDGVPSLLVAVRDVSSARRLEASLQKEEAERASRQQKQAEQHQLALLQREREAREALSALRAELERAAAEQQQRLRAALDASDAERQKLRAALEETRADQQLLQSALEHSDAARRRLRAALDQAVAERDAFELKLKEHDDTRQRLVAERDEGRIAAERALANARGQIEQLDDALTAILDAASVARQALQSERRE